MDTGPRVIEAQSEPQQRKQEAKFSFQRPRSKLLPFKRPFSKLKIAGLPSSRSSESSRSLEETSSTESLSSMRPESSAEDSEKDLIQAEKPQSKPSLLRRASEKIKSLDYDRSVRDSLIGVGFSPSESSESLAEKTDKEKAIQAANLFKEIERLSERSESLETFEQNDKSADLAEPPSSSQLEKGSVSLT